MEAASFRRLPHFASVQACIVCRLDTDVYRGTRIKKVKQINMAHRQAFSKRSEIPTVSDRNKSRSMARTGLCTLEMHNMHFSQRHHEGAYCNRD